jgi:hypothetical protein
VGALAALGGGCRTRGAHRSVLLLLLKLYELLLLELVLLELLLLACLCLRL